MFNFGSLRDDYHIGSVHVLAVLAWYYIGTFLIVHGEKREIMTVDIMAA